MLLVPTGKRSLLLLSKWRIWLILIAKGLSNKLISLPFLGYLLSWAIFHLPVNRNSAEILRIAIGNASSNWLNLHYVRIESLWVEHNVFLPLWFVSLLVHLLTWIFLKVNKSLAILFLREVTWSLYKYLWWSNGILLYSSDRSWFLVHVWVIAKIFFRLLLFLTINLLLFLHIIF